MIYYLALHYAAQLYITQLRRYMYEGGGLDNLHRAGVHVLWF